MLDCYLEINTDKFLHSLFSTQKPDYYLEISPVNFWSLFAFPTKSRLKVRSEYFLVLLGFPTIRPWFRTESESSGNSTGMAALTHTAHRSLETAAAVDAARSV